MPKRTISATRLMRRQMVNVISRNPTRFYWFFTGQFGCDAYFANNIQRQTRYIAKRHKGKQHKTASNTTALFC